MVEEGFVATKKKGKKAKQRVGKKSRAKRRKVRGEVAREFHRFEKIGLLIGDGSPSSMLTGPSWEFPEAK